jgi:hypothetical protein
MISLLTMGHGLREQRRRRTIARSIEADGTVKV